MVLELLSYAGTAEFVERLEDFLKKIKKLDDTEDTNEFIQSAIKYLMNVNEHIDYNDLKEKSNKNNFILFVDSCRKQKYFLLEIH